MRHTVLAIAGHYDGSDTRHACTRSKPSETAAKAAHAMVFTLFGASGQSGLTGPMSMIDEDKKCKSECHKPSYNTQRSLAAAALSFIVLRGSPSLKEEGCFLMVTLSEASLPAMSIFRMSSAPQKAPAGMKR